jgi:hypothetical protein
MTGLVPVRAASGSSYVVRSAATRALGAPVVVAPVGRRGPTTRGTPRVPRHTTPGLVRSLHWLVAAVVTVFLTVELGVATLSTDHVPSPGWTSVQVRLDRMTRSGACWTGPGVHPHAHHAFFVTPTSGLHYGPSGPAFAIVFGPDGVPGSGDEASGRVSAFCR